MTRNTNFRANFLEKISGVEFGDSLSAEAARRVLKEQILSSKSDIDLSKLAQFAVKHQIPECYHVLVWKLLLEISSCYAEGKAAVDLHRREEAEMLLKSLQIMQKTNSLDIHSLTYKDVVSMIKLRNSSVSISALSQSSAISVSDNALHCIAKQLFPLCNVSVNGWIDAYWLTLKFSELFGNLFDENPKHLNKFTADVYTHVCNLYNSCDQHQFTGGIASTSNLLSNNCYPNDDTLKAVERRNSLYLKFFDYFSDKFVINVWFRSGGSSLLNSEPLYRLWDKLSTGEAIGVLLKFTLIELITSLSHHCLSPASSSHADNLTINEFLKTTLTRDMQMRAICHAIEYVSRMGIFNTRMTEPSSTL